MRFRDVISGPPFGMQKADAIKDALLRLSHHLGSPAHQLALAGEGNTSAAIDQETFWIKASGTELGQLHPDELVRVRFDSILAMFDRQQNQEETEAALYAARAGESGLKPSVETAFHAWLLRQPGVGYVGHTHPTAVNKILCSDQAAAFAGRCLFPDQVVYCGPKALLVAYVDPGVRLAQAIRDDWQAFAADNGFPPKLILLRNHGIIAVGPSPDDVLATTLMAVKSAEVFLGASTLGGPVFMDEAEVMTIHARLDEHYRQKQLKIL